MFWSHTSACCSPAWSPIASTKRRRWLTHTHHKRVRQSLPVKFHPQAFPHWRHYDGTKTYFLNLKVQFEVFQPAWYEDQQHSSMHPDEIPFFLLQPFCFSFFSCVAVDKYPSPRGPVMVCFQGRKEPDEKPDSSGRAFNPPVGHEWTSHISLLWDG